MAEAAEPIIPINTPSRTFECHKSIVSAVEIFPDERRMATGSTGKTLQVSGDGQMIGSSDKKGELIARDGNTVESITQSIKVHPKMICSLKFPSDSAVLVAGSWDITTIERA
ncbi:hypothetical protein AZE42_05484 [Rhizopogon vesiculosus]|uniref:Uncharacterized protein n=1 Tax=Rhizopogon vesiculosus TaxID=180088 RepID=A0A1J8QRH2_9AGAM|nr:hypothetical protein AZE42_05484 [Rhizopogon vesiculosus]